MKNDQQSTDNKDKDNKDSGGKEEAEDEGAKSEKKASNKKKGESRSKAPPKEKKVPATGTRKSARIGDKRAASEADVHEAEDDEEIEEDRKTNKRATKK